MRRIRKGGRIDLKVAGDSYDLIARNSTISVRSDIDRVDHQVGQIVYWFWQDIRNRLLVTDRWGR